MAKNIAILYSWLKGFCFILVIIPVKITAAETKLEDLNFNIMAVGHSGLLISWDADKVKDRRKSLAPYFIFVSRAIRDKDNNITSGKIYTTAGQYQISKLNECTSYQINITYNHDVEYLKRFNETYYMEGKTEQRIISSPQQPDLKWTFFSYSIPTINIRWLPCGKYKECDRKHPSTHFSVRYKVSLSKEWFESGEIYKGFYDIEGVFAGKLYEVIVTSINGGFKMDSDMEEIFIQPKSGPVQSVKVIQLSNTSLIINWKPPRNHLRIYLSSFLVSYVESKNNMKVARFYSPDYRGVGLYTLWRRGDADAYEQVQWTNLTQATEYCFFIIPQYMEAQSSVDAYGFEYSIHYILHPQNSASKLPLAKPDSRVECDPLDYTSGFCNCKIRWLPCGQQHECKNTRPGSYFMLQIRDERKNMTILNEKIVDEDSRFIKIGKANRYEVTVRSLDGAEISEFATRKINGSLVCWLVP